MSLRAGVVGWGDAGKIHARYLIEHGAHLAGIVSRSKPGEAIPWFRSLEELLPAVDAVSITTPNFLHAESVLKSVRAGKAVLVEKPLCIRQDELAQLQMVLPSLDVPVHVGFRLRFNDTIRKMRRPDSSPSRVHCSYRLGIERLAAGKSWTRDRSLSGGAFFVLGVHCLDLVRWICAADGRPISNLMGMSDSHPDFPLQVSLMGQLGETQIGISVDLRGSSAYHLRLSVDWPDQERPRVASLSGERPGVREEAEFSGLIENFVRAAKQGAPDPRGVAELLQIHRELLAARDQIES